MPEQSSPSPHHTPKPGHGPKGLGRGQSPTPTISGRLLLALSAFGCIILFFIVWASLRVVEQQIRDAQPVLQWTDRETWFAPSVIQTTLVKPNASNVQYTYNKPRYRDPGLVIPIEEEQAVLTLAQIATNPNFTDDVTQRSVLQHARSPNNFYAQYLLATWYQLNNDPTAADTQYQLAITHAPKIIVIQYKDEQGNPVPNLKLDPIEIGCDRVIDEGTALDQRLVLIYPHQKTDVTGRVYLPVYDTTYRPVYLPQPDGYEVTYSPAEGWFKLPTRLGTIAASIDNRAE